MGGKLFAFMTNVLIISFVRCEPCSRQQSVNVTSGDLQDGDSILHEGTVYKSEQWYEVVEDGIVSRLGCPCLDRVCIKKCCKQNYMYINNSCQAITHESLRFFSPNVYKGKDLLNITAHLHFFYLYELQCSKYLIDPPIDLEELYIQEVRIQET